MKTVIKQDLGLYVLFEHLECIKTSCFGVLASDNTMNALFFELYERCANLVQEKYCGDIVEQYVLTVLEED